MVETSIAIGGMTCEHCVLRVQRALDALEGVEARVTLGHAVVRHNGLPESALVAAIEDAGYEVGRSVVPPEVPPVKPALMDELRTSIPVLGMHCASCVGAVERELTSIPGVHSAYVNLAAQQATILHASGVAEDALRQAVSSAGYSSPVQAEGESIWDLRDRAQEAEMALVRRKLWVSVPLTVAVVGLAMVPMVVPGLQFDHRWSLPVQAALSLPVWLYGGGRYLKGLALSALRRSADMNTLIGLGTSVAYLWSLAAWAWSIHGPDGHPLVYFESTATIVVLILVGHALEGGAKRRASNAIRSLLSLVPESARVLVADVEREVAVKDLIPGDLLRVLPGERVPTDARVVKGGASLDVSAVTGEAIPEEVSVGADICGGSLNLDGELVLEVVRPGATSMIGRIVKKVEQAQGSRAPIQRLADRISAVFVPVVLVISAATFVFWGWWEGWTAALTHGVAVLIVACPCALGIATPTSVLVGTGRGARLGVLFRDTASLENAGTLKILALDKTGTLTEGRPRVEGVHPIGGESPENVLCWAAAAESSSDHPLARAIRAAGPAVLPATTGFKSEVGRGISAVVDGRMVRVGSRKALLEQGITIEQHPIESTGASVVWVAADDRAIGAIAIVDTPREGVKVALERIRGLGVTLVMLTGDRREAAEAVAKTLGVERVIAGVLPDEKGEQIEELLREGLVGMVGDGINDGPALALATVGFAMRSGTDVAMDAAPVALLRDDLSAVADAISLSRQTMRNIRQNLAFAFVYNVLGIPLAAGVLSFWGWTLSPMFAAGAMALSSVCVVTNSLRLQRSELG